MRNTSTKPAAKPVSPAVTKPATKPVSAVKPIVAAPTATAGKRKLATAKPAAKPVIAADSLAARTGNVPVGAAVSAGNLGKAAKPAAVTSPAAKRGAAPASAPVAAPAKPAANLTRTATTVARAATNFGGLSDRDAAYIAFYAAFAKRDGTVTLAAIVASGNRPAYAGSNKPHDAGVIVRLTKAGLIKPASDGASFTFLPAGQSLAAYSTAKPLAKA